MPCGVWGWDMVISGGRELRREMICWIHRTCVHWGGKVVASIQVLCWGWEYWLSLEEQRNWRSVDSLRGCPISMACGLMVLWWFFFHNTTYEMCFITYIYDHIKLTLVDDMRWRSKFIFFHVTMQLVQHHLMKILFFCQWINSLAIFNLLTVKTVVL